MSSTDASRQSSTAGDSGALVSRWIEAHNDRDIDGMLACVQPEVEFHPLRLTLLGDVYVGCDGLRLWLSEVVQRGIQHLLLADEITQVGEEVMVVGSVDLPGSSKVADFYGIYRIKDGLIDRAQHYISDSRTMSDLGLLRQRPA